MRSKFLMAGAAALILSSAGMAAPVLAQVTAKQLEKDSEKKDPAAADAAVAKDEKSAAKKSASTAKSKAKMAASKAKKAAKEAEDAAKANPAGPVPYDQLKKDANDDAKVAKKAAGAAKHKAKVAADKAKTAVDKAGDAAKAQ